MLNIKQTADELLSEQLATEHGFAEKSLEQISAELEVLSESLNGSGELSPQQVQTIESFERCRAHVCLLLLELEAHHQTELYQRPVGQWFEAPLPETQPEEPSLSPLQPTPPLAESLPPLLTDLTDETGAFDLDIVMAPEAPPGEAPPPLTEWDLPLSDEPLPLNTPDTEISSEVPPELPNDIPDIAPEIPAQPSLVFRSETAHEYHSVADAIAASPFLKHLPQGRSHQARLTNQYACFALEAEIAARLTPGLEQFWQDRGEAIRCFLDTNQKRVDLKPELKRALDTLTSTQESGIFDLSFTGILNTLRYLLAVPQPETFQPTLQESGTLILLFGHQETWGETAFHNSLGVTGLTSAEVPELGARLMKLFRAKNRLLNGAYEWTEENSRELAQETEALWPLALKLESGKK